MRRMLPVVMVGAGAARAQQSAVVVAEPAPTGVDEGSPHTFAELLRADLGRQGFRVVPRGKTPQAPCGDAACAAELMRDLLNATPRRHHEEKRNATTPRRHETLVFGRH